MDLPRRDDLSLQQRRRSSHIERSWFLGARAVVEA